MKYISARSLLAFVPAMRTSKVNANAAAVKMIGIMFQQTRRTPMVKSVAKLFVVVFIQDQLNPG